MPVPAPPTSLPAPWEKRRYVRDMFSDIAPSYDLLNRVLSLNIDRSWRRRTLERLEWGARPEGLYLDACAGTLDLAALLATQPGFRGKVVASDFALPMLRRGGSKVDPAKVNLTASDTLVLPFKSGTFDGATIGFGVRNLADLSAGFGELARVLKPGARLVVLDCATPHFAPLRMVYLAYFRNILPLIGRLVSGHPTAYNYLPDSVLTFPPPDVLEGLMVRSGFGGTGHQLLTGGIAAVTWGVR